MTPVSRRSPLAFLIVSASVAMSALAGLPAQGVSVGLTVDDPNDAEVSAVDPASPAPANQAPVDGEFEVAANNGAADGDAMSPQIPKGAESPEPESNEASVNEQPSDGATEEASPGESGSAANDEPANDVPQGDAGQSGDGVSTDAPQSEAPPVEVERPAPDVSPFRRARNTPPAFANPNDPSLQPVVAATGGDGKYVENILWLEWPAGNLIDEPRNANGNPSSLTRHSYRDVSPRVRVVTSCTISNLHYRANRNQYRDRTGPITSYVPGTWRGDYLDKLYNKGGAGRANTMRIGIKNESLYSTPTFDLECTAQVLTRESANPNARFTDSRPFSIDGFVFADAEAANYHSGAQEWVQATTYDPTTWYVLDTNPDPESCPPQSPEPAPSTRSSIPATASFAELTNDTIRILPNGKECRSPKGTPGSVVFAHGTSRARLTLQGNGTQALALGIIVPSDLGDAPESYGEAVALYHPTWRNPLRRGTVNLHRGARPAEMGVARYVLGRESDHDVTEVYSPLADRDTNDDAISAAAAYFEVYPGATATMSVRCGGGGAVAGWVDWNLNGKFDSDEKSDEVRCLSNTVDLSWTVPDSALRAVKEETFNAQQTILRLRTAAPEESTLGGGQPLQPTGPTLSGEVEDHGIQLFIPRLKLENKVATRNPYGGTLRPASDWKVKASFEAAGGVANKEFAANGTFTDSVPIGNFTLSVESANGQEIRGYVNDGWTCAKTPNSQDPRRKPYASTFNSGASRLTIPQADHVTCTITHRPIPGELVWRKVDQQGNLLSGSEWQVRGPSARSGARVVDCKQAPCSAGVGALRDADPRPGVMRVDRLQWGVYTLTETKAPAGYVLSTDVKRADVEGVTDLGEIANEMHQPLVIPLTGGTASIFYVLAGGGLTVVAVAGAAAIGNRGRSRG